MACSCQTRSAVVESTSSEVVQQPVRLESAAVSPQLRPAAGRRMALPHEVLPDDSCVFCALKHASTALAELAADGYLPLVVGELELARRHTRLEFGEQAEAAGRALLAALSPDRSGLPSMVHGLCLELQKLADAGGAAAESGGSEKSAGMFSYRRGYRVVRSTPTTNPLKAGVHLCAAWRLAAEVGYMGVNRAMIIGDLALAREHVVRFDIELSDRLRELRHRIQLARRSDLDRVWVDAIALLDRKTAGRELELWQAGKTELEAWLLPDKQVSDKDETRK